MITLPDIQIKQPGLPELDAGINSLGLVIPFQPSMVDSKTINGILSYTLEVVAAKLESKYQQENTNAIIKRLEKIFTRLNFNSHRKSVAIIIDGDDEKIIYLNYSGKPVFITDTPFSLLDLVGESVRNPEFELLYLGKKHAELYEYFNDSLHKVFAQTNNFCNDRNTGSACLIRRIGNIVKQINKKNDKPVFIVSEEEQQTHKFLKFFSYSEIVFAITPSSKEFDVETTRLLVERINRQWNFWQCKLVEGQIAIAKKYQSLYSHLNSVIKVLKDSNDGLLLIDSFMKEEIHRSLKDETLFLATQKLTDEIEKFLARGNRIEITKGGLLEAFGGIALIKETNSQPYQSYRLTRRYKEEDFLI